MITRTRPSFMAMASGRPVPSAGDGEVMKKFEYKAGVSYQVLHGKEVVLKTSWNGVSVITNAIKSGISKLLKGKIDSISVVGDAGSYVVIKVDNFQN